MDSPASKAFADRLAKYAFDPSSSSRARTRSTRAAAGPGPATALARNSSPVSGPSAVKRKRRNRADDEEFVAQDEDEYISSPSRTPARRSASSTPGRTTPKSGKKPRPFAGPEVYAHLKPVTDHLKPDLDIVFCGINPGKMSSTLGHHFAHPTNKFWKSLHQSGITDRLVSPREDHLIPELYNLGLTNLCDRPTSEQSELSTLEMRLNVYNLTTKILAHRPRVVCFVGKKIWDIYEGVVLKTAGPPVVAAAAHVPPSEAPYLVKLEEDEEGVKAERVEPGGSISLEQGNSGGLKIVTLAPTGVVKVEPSTPPKPSPSGSAAAASRSTTPAKSSKTGIDWSKPRGARLPHDGGYTYFWVTPNTSGLERTPLAEQVRIFAHLRDFARTVKSGQALEGTYRDIDIEGVRQTVESIRAAAVAKGSL